MSKLTPTATEREQEATILRLRSENSVLKAKLAAKNKQQRRARMDAQGKRAGKASAARG